MICYPELILVLAEIAAQGQLISEFLTQCTNDECDACGDTEYHNLQTALLQNWGRISQLMQMNRAIYPLPSGEGIIVDL